MKTKFSFSKRILALLLSVLMLLTSGIISAVAVTVDLAQTGVTMTGGEKLYLTPNSNWKADNARYAIYVFGTGNAWVSMTAVSGETDLYEATVPTGSWTNVIFCRMNPSSSTNDWNNKWNQTADLTYDGTNNHYTVKSGTWDSGGGTWSVYTPPVVVTAPDTPAAPTVVFNNTYGGTGTQADPYLVEAGVKTNMTVTGVLGDADGLAYNVNYTDSYVAWDAGETSFAGYQGVTAPALGVTQAVNTYLWAYNGTKESHEISDGYATTTVYIKGVYTATFNDSDNEQIGDTVIYDGTAISAPEAPSIDGYTFTGWTADDGTFYSKDAALAITKNTTFTATYSANPYSFTLNCDETAGSVAIDPENADTIHHDDTIKLTATAKDGYNFTGWSGSNGTDSISSTTNPLTITVKGDVDVTANFEKLTEYTVTISSADSTMGTVDNTTVTGYYGDTVTITANPASSDYVVDYWTVDGVKVNEGNKTYTLTITGNHDVKVYWIKQGWTGIIYVEDDHSNPWDSMNIYTWKSGTSTNYTGGWPGTAMTQITTNNGNPVYAIRVDVDSSIVANNELKVILSNNGASQTGDDDIKVTTTQNYIIIGDSSITYSWSNLSVDLPITVYFDNGTTDTKNGVKIGQTTAVADDNLIEISDLKTADANDLGGYREALVNQNSTITFTTTLETKESDYYVAGWVINGDKFVTANYMGTNSDGYGYYQNSYTFTESRNTVVPIYFHTDNWLAANNMNTVKVYAVGDPSISTWDRYMGAFTWDDDNSYEQFGRWQGQLMIPVEGLDNVYYTFVEKSSNGTVADNPDGITFSNFGYNTDRPSYPVTEYSNIQTYDYYEFLELLEQGKENITFVLKPETDTDHKSDSFDTNTSISTAYDFDVFTDASALKKPLDIDRNSVTSETVGLYIVRQYVKDTSNPVGDYSIRCHLYKPDGTYLGYCASYELLDIPTLSAKEGFEYLASTELDGKTVMVAYESKTTEDNGVRYDGEWYADADVNVKVNLYAYVGLTTNNGATFTTDTDETDGLNVADYGSAYAEGGAVATVVKGKSATVSAVPKAGYKFIGWYSPNGTLFSTQSAYTIADVSFDTYVTAVFQKLANDEFVITHDLYKGGATGYNPEAFGGTGYLYIGVADENGNDIIPMTLTNSLSVTDVTEGETYIIKIATDPHGADKFYAWYTSALDKFGNTTYEEVGVDNYTDGTYGNLFDNGMDTVVGSNDRVEFWFKHTVGTDFTLDLYSNIIAVSANVKLVYKYEDRTGAERSVTVPYTLTDAEVDNGYVPSDDVVKKYAPYVDDYYTEVTWDITRFDDASFIIWAKQDDPVYMVTVNFASESKIFPGTYNAEMEINATDFGAKSDKGYWFEDDGDGVYEAGEKIVAYGRYYGLRITENVTLCYVEDDSINFDIVLDQPVYTREQETDADGNVTTDKIYIDYLTSILVPLFRNSQTAGGVTITDTYYNGDVILNANSPVTIETLVKHYNYTIEYGVILEQLKNTADYGVNRSDDETLENYVINGKGYNADKTKYATVFNATSNPITNKNRLLITIDMNNTPKNQARYYNVYGYLKVTNDKGETEYFFSDMRTLNIIEYGNKTGDELVVTQ